MIKCPICNNVNDDTADSCLACGFKFSGATQSFKPLQDNQTIEYYQRQTDSNNANNQNKICALRVIRGPQGEILLPLSKTKMTIGRSPDSDIFLNDRTVSRNHAIVAKNGDTYQICDCNSYNGVWVNNKNITVCDLKNCDVIQIGVFFLKFEEL